MGDLDLDLAGDEELAALLWAMHHQPPPPADVQKADTAQRALWSRIKSDPFRELTRDEKRLDRHYTAVHDAHLAQVLDHYRNR